MRNIGLILLALFLTIKSAHFVKGQCASCNQNSASAREWHGDVSSDWNDPNNWESNMLPTVNSSVVIDPSNYTNSPVISSASVFTPGDVFIENGGLLTIQSDFSISDDFLIRDNGSTLIVEGGSNATGDDINLCAGGIINISGGELNNDNSPNQSGEFRICETTPSGQNTPEVAITGGSFISTTSVTQGGNTIDDYITVSGDGFFTDDVNGTLPVELLWFKGNSEGRLVKLSWQTASEINNSHFEIQRSFDQKSFTTLESIAGKGTTNEISNYSFYDNNPLNLGFYKLIQFDNDGKSSSFQTIAVENQFIEKSYSVYYDFSFKAPIRIYSQNKIDYQLYNETGRLITQGIVKDSALISTSNLNKGLYYLRILESNGRYYTHKVLLR